MIIWTTGKIMLSGTGYRRGIILRSEKILVTWLLDRTKRTNSYSLVLPGRKNAKFIPLYFYLSKKIMLWYNFLHPYRWIKMQTPEAVQGKNKCEGICGRHVSLKFSYLPCNSLRPDSAFRHSDLHFHVHPLRHRTILQTVGSKCKDKLDESMNEQVFFQMHF